MDTGNNYYLQHFHRAKDSISNREVFVVIKIDQIKSYMHNYKYAMDIKQCLTLDLFLFLFFLYEKWTLLD